MAGYADCLAGFIDRLQLEKPHLAGLSFGGALALAFSRRHPAIPATLILASAYAGWGGSLPADVAQQRLQQALVLAELSPEEFVGALLPTMFSQTTPPEAVDAFGTSMLGFHPAGFRAMAQASAEDLREVLPHINVPTLLIYGDADVRAPDRRPRPQGSDPGLYAARAARHRSPLQYRSSRAVQQRRPHLLRDTRS